MKTASEVADQRFKDRIFEDLCVARTAPAYPFKGTLDFDTRWIDESRSAIAELYTKYLKESLPRMAVRVDELYGTAGVGTAAPPTQPKEQHMLTTQHLINGRNIKHMSDADIYNAIAATEAEIKRLREIRNQPMRLVKHIERLQADIKAVVELLDKRDAAEGKA